MVEKTSIGRSNTAITRDLLCFFFPTSSPSSLPPSLCLHQQLPKNRRRHCRTPSEVLRVLGAVAHRKQRVEDRENVRNTTIELLENTYHSIFEHDHNHLSESTAREIFIDCRGIILQTDGSQSSPFFKPWKLQELNDYPLDYADRTTREWSD